MISRFNSISFWVAKMILTEEKLKQRVKIVIKVIKIAHTLFRLGSFNSLLAVLSGLNHSAVYRLKFTMEEIPSSLGDHVQKCNELFSSDKGYKNYRAHIHKINPPLIPYLGVYLTDLTFMEEGNSDTMGNNLINFKKREMIFSVIMEIQQYQHQAYIFDAQSRLIQYLADLPVIENTKAIDAELFEMSLLREPFPVIISIF